MLHRRQVSDCLSGNAYFPVRPPRSVCLGGALLQYVGFVNS